MILHTRIKSVRYKCTERFFITALLCTTMSSCQQETQTKLIGEAQGTYYSIAYYDAEKRDLQPQVDSLLQQFDMTASLWEENSLLRRINSNTTNKLSPELTDLIDKSIGMHTYTNGAFDCTIGNIVNAWGFGYKNGTKPDSDTIKALLENCGTEKIGIERSPQVDYSIIHKPAGLEIDLNAIAQGAAVDMIGQYFESKGIENYLIDIGGEVRARGKKDDGSLWKVGIETPSETKYDTRSIDAVIELDNRSVVTSGNYRKYYIEDGVKYSHTIDPKTGHPVNHTLLSVSVVDKEAWRADALATAFMVMGLDSALSFIAQNPKNDAVYFIYNEDGEYKTHATPAFEKMILKKANTK